jgi:hypothetical protein
MRKPLLNSMNEGVEADADTSAGSGEFTGRDKRASGEEWASDDA